jgi:ATP-binding cassette subfamily C protein
MSLIGKLWALFNRRERIRLVLLLMATLFGAGLEVLGIGFVLPLISFISDPSTIADYPRLMKLFGVFNVTSPRDILVYSCFTGLGLFLIKNAFLSITMMFQFRVIYDKLASLSSQLLSAYLHSPWTFHLQRNSAELLRNISHEVTLLFGNVLNPLATLVTEGLIAVAIVALLLVIQPVAASVALAYLGAASLLFYRWIQKRSDAAGVAQQRYRLAMLQSINQALGGIKETKVLGREDFFVRTYAADVDGYVANHKILWVVGQLPRLFLETLMVSGMLLVSALLLMSDAGGSAILPTLSLFGAAAFRLMPSANRLLTAFGTVRYHRPSVEVIYDDMKLLRWADDAKIPPPRVPPGKLAFQRAVEVRDVSFRYPESDRNTLHKIDMTIPKGCSVALTGPSGAGKTTLVDVILGLLKPDAGQVLVDGRSIDENLAAWQQQIGYVPQTIYLTDDTIRRNIAFGLPDREIRDEQVWAALRYAQLEEFVRQLPEGLDTSVGERGVRLSGGQRQRIGIARALYHDPEVLVLDEATSSLDTDTEREFTAAIEGLAGAKTLIIIAHRMSTVEKCDVQYRIRGGKMERHYTASSSISKVLVH